MNEKILNNRKNGMPAMIVTILLYAAAIAGCIFGGIALDQGNSPVLLIVSIIWLCIGWIPLCGLKVVKPQEALVLLSLIHISEPTRPY